MGQMKVLCSQGDITLEWDKADPDSVAKAKEEYARLKKDGYEFYEVEEAKGKRLTRFNKNAEKIIAAPGVKKATDKAKGTRKGAMSGGPNAAPVGL